MLQSRERFLRPWLLIMSLSQANRDVIEKCDLSSSLHMARYIINKGLLTALVERWHSDTNTFHLATGNIIVTPKDCYRILCSYRWDLVAIQED